MDNKSYRILNLEGAWLQNIKNEFIFSTKDERTYKRKDGKEIKYKSNENKLYSATMPYSLETYRAFNKLPDEVIIKDNELFTNLFINFKFTKDSFDDNKDDDSITKTTKKKLRKQIYTSIVKIDDVEYCFFKRGASKARTANVIFVKKEYYKQLYNPCLLGLKFEENKEYDITSKEAYVSLIMSGIIGTIDIKSDEILIINDIMSPTKKYKQTVTKRDAKGNIYQDEDNFDVVNNMTDGQALMDESIFVKNDVINTATCALLRNDFLKANACRTRLQEYYKENNIAKVWDMYRGWIDSSRIKLVITPSSCKYLKFADQFNSEKDCFLDWLNRMPSVFGVVKTDHIGNYGYSNRLSYQMLNSINLSTDGKVKKLMEDELKYYKLLKDNTLVNSKELSGMTKKNKKVNRQMRNDMTHFLTLVLDKNDEELTTSDMLSDLIKRNIDFRFTQKFKDWKNEQLQDYISNLRLGKVRIKNSIYAIMISCPYEMLIATTKENNQIDSCIMDGWECYCPTFEQDTKLLAIRNPQINEGNIGYIINKYHKEYKWFGYYNEDKPHHDFVVFINSYNTDIMNRLQGCDWDIDSVYLTDNKLLQEKAYESLQWSTPANGINGGGDKKKLNNKSLAELDNYLGGSTMAIGKIVNKSAVFNAYMYDGINKGFNQDYIYKCYEASSTLSSFSQIAIDMAKKKFKGLSLTKEMNNLNKKTYIDDDGQERQILRFEKDKMIVPYFFKYIAKDNSYRIPTPMQCSMDFLEDILDKLDTKAMDTEKVDIKDLMVLQKDLDGRAFSRNKIDKARVIIDNCQSVLNKNRFDNLDSKEESRQKNNMRYWIKKQSIKELKALKLNEKTIYRILIRAFNLDKDYKGQELKKVDEKGKVLTYIDYNNIDDDTDDFMEFDMTVREFKEMNMLVLTLMYNVNKEVFIKCFKEKKMENFKRKIFWL